MPSPTHLSYEETDSAPTRWIVLFVLLSLLAHAVIFLVIILLSIFFPPAKFEVPPPPPETSTLTMIAPPVPQKRMFMPTEAQANVKPKDTQIESDHDTEAKSKSKVERDKNAIMPDVVSKNDHSSQLVDSPNIQSKPTPPATPAPPTPKAEDQPKEQQTPPQTQTAKTESPKPDKPTEKPPDKPKPPPPKPQVVKVQVDANGLPLLPDIMAPTMAQASPSQTRKAQTAAPQPVDPAVAANMQGRAGMSGAPSPEAMATDLGKYKAIVYRAVGTRWYQKVQNQIQLLGVGVVRVQYTIYWDGSVMTKVLSGDSGDMQLLMAISVNSIREAAPFPPFSESMKKKFPGGSYTDDFSFSIYGGG